MPCGLDSHDCTAARDDVEMDRINGRNVGICSFGYRDQKFATKSPRYLAGIGNKKSRHGSCIVQRQSCDCFEISMHHLACLMNERSLDANLQYRLRLDTRDPQHLCVGM
eukprot:TRINITY_DN13113_c0_g1_i1.p1 TRINITY_DN13113_c0_g1~~TRINITY_DN13113_c0_g1_i1.p1  ORF type:complete len:109 (-),score=11.94 TRINITY_DN13113_c0_g1_i1:45-371(-)